MKVQSSEKWCKEKGIVLGEHILDPDGWDRSNFEHSWNEKITEKEFQYRVMMSTCSLPITDKLF